MILDIISTHPYPKAVKHGKHLMYESGEAMNEKLRPFGDVPEFKTRIEALNFNTIVIEGLDKDRREFLEARKTLHKQYKKLSKRKTTTIKLDKVLSLLNKSTERYNEATDKTLGKLEEMLAVMKVLDKDIDLFIEQHENKVFTKEEILDAMCQMKNPSDKYIYDIVDCKLVKTLGHNPIPLTTYVSIPKVLNIQTTHKIKSWDIVDHIRKTRK